MCGCVQVLRAAGLRHPDDLLPESYSQSPRVPQGTYGRCGLFPARSPFLLLRLHLHK